MRRTLATHATLNDNQTLGAAVTEDYWYKYDALNRMTLVKGSLVGGQIVRSGEAARSIAYDLAGRLTAVHVATGTQVGRRDDPPARQRQRRWPSASAQWPMILSGAQSGVAGVFFVKMAADASANPSISDIAPYAAFGALYFSISAALLAIPHRRSAK